MIDADLSSQITLIEACLDDFNPSSALPNKLGGEFGENTDEWRMSVINFITECMEKKLIKITNGCKYKNMNANDVKKILIDGDEVGSIDKNTIFYAIYFTATEKLIDIVNDLNLLDWESMNKDINSDLFNRINYG